MAIIMADGSFRLKGRQIYAQGISSGRFRNIKEMAEASNISRPTASILVNNPEGVSQLDLNNFTNLLVDGLGIKPEDVLDMTFGEFFAFIPRGVESSSE